MSLRILRRVSQSQNAKPLSAIFFSKITRSFSQSKPASFGIVFDIDGVVLRSEIPIGGSPQAIRRLYDDSGNLRIPYVFLTNGGGFPESKRALELSELLGVKVSPSQVLQAHTPFKQLVNRFHNELIVAVGKGEPAAVMSDYGFQNVLSIDDYAACFENIDPLAPYKKWTTKQFSYQNSTSKEVAIQDLVRTQRVKAAFILGDSVDWSRDIQVLCDILRTGGLPGREIGHQPQLYFAHDDLAYQAAFPSERFGLGAFRIALESIFNRIHPHPLEYTTFGKPNSFVFKNAELVLKQLVSSLHDNVQVANHEIASSHQFKTLYMVGDNPSVDIKGARQVYPLFQAGLPWFSILTRTGVFRGKENHDEFPADLVVCNCILSLFIFDKKSATVSKCENSHMLRCSDATPSQHKSESLIVGSQSQPLNVATGRML